MGGGKKDFRYKIFKQIQTNLNLYEGFITNLQTDSKKFEEPYQFYNVKGVLHLRPVFGLFMHFSQKLQHIGNKYGIFLIGNIPGNLVTALEFH